MAKKIDTLTFMVDKGALIHKNSSDTARIFLDFIRDMPMDVLIELDTIYGMFEDLNIPGIGPSSAFELMAAILWLMAEKGEEGLGFGDYIVRAKNE